MFELTLLLRWTDLDITFNSLLTSFFNKRRNHCRKIRRSYRLKVWLFWLSKTYFFELRRFYMILFVL